MAPMLLQLQTNSFARTEGRMMLIQFASPGDHFIRRRLSLPIERQSTRLSHTITPTFRPASVGTFSVLPNENNLTTINTQSQYCMLISIFPLRSGFYSTSHRLNRMQGYNTKTRLTNPAKNAWRLENTQVELNLVYFH